MDIGKMAREAGLRWPMAVSPAVWEIIQDIPPGSGQTIRGRVWDILWILSMLIRLRKAGAGDSVHFSVRMDRGSSRTRNLDLRAVIGPDGDAQDLLTLKLSEED